MRSAAKKQSVRDYALFLIACRHGLRATEIGLLQVSDLDFRRMQLRIHRLKGSFGSEHLMQPDEARGSEGLAKKPAARVAYLFTSNRNLPIDGNTLD